MTTKAKAPEQMKFMLLQNEQFLLPHPTRASAENHAAAIRQRGDSFVIMQADHDDDGFLYWRVITQLQ